MSYPLQKKALFEKNKLKQKGVVLLMVMGLSLILSVGVIAFLFVLDAHRRNVENLDERAKAYYLCETGASVAILDLGQGRIGSGSGQWTIRNFNYNMGGTDYPIKYTVTKVNGAWNIVSEVGSSAGFQRTYKLRVGGRRAFPIFIRGFAGK